MSSSQPASSFIRYDRQTLLKIGEQCGNTGVLDPEVRSLLTREHIGRSDPPERTWTRTRERRRGRRAGLQVRVRRRGLRPPMPSIFLANVQSLDNKLDDLRGRLQLQRELRNCCVLCFTETWLTENIPDHAVLPDGFTIHRADRTESSGKKRGGGVCFLINNSWCTNVEIISRNCTPDLEYLLIKCRPFYLPREFSAVFLAAVYIPPQANTHRALSELYQLITSHENAQPDGLFVVSGDFNRANFRTVYPKYHQHVSCPTRGANTLDHCYTEHRGAYRSLSRAHFGASDHSAVLLLPAYRQRLKREEPVSRTVQRWTREGEEKLQDCLDCVDWDMFRDSSSDLDEYTTAVTDFIKTCVEECIPTKTVRSFPNQKPWVNADVRRKLRERTRAFQSGDTELYKKCRYDLRKAIRSAKREYSSKVDSQFSCTRDARQMWRGIQALTDYKPRAHTLVSDSSSLPNELNAFFARFELANLHPPERAPAALHDDVIPTVSVTDVRKSFERVNTRKAAGPDGISGKVLKVCSEQLSAVFTDIFNTSLKSSTVPTCFKLTTIVPVPKKNKASCLNDFRPVALTSITMKCFERLVMGHIMRSMPTNLDPLQFAYRHNRSTEDAISHTIHTTLAHLDNKNCYARLLFVDYSSAFNTVVPSKLITKLLQLGLSTTLCNWVLDFLTNRPQHVRIGKNTSSTMILNTGTPQGSVLSPMLYSLFTHDCVSRHSSNTIIKFADDTTIVGLIYNDDETAYREEVRLLAEWCQENNLSLNTSKTKEMVLDFRKHGAAHPPIYIGGDAVERVSSFRLLGVTLSADLKSSEHAAAVTKKAHQRLHFLRRLKKAGVSTTVLTSFYRCAVESILTGSVASWYGSCNVQDAKGLQRVVKTAQRIIGTPLPAITDIYSTRCLRKTKNIINDPSHPALPLFTFLPSGRRLRTIHTRTTRFRNSFYPSAIRLFNAQ